MSKSGTTYKWDAENGYTQLATCPASMSQAGAVYFNGAIHLFGSYATGKGKLHYIYDIETNTWSSSKSLSYSSSGMGCVIFEDNVYLIGGLHPDNSSSFVYSKYVYKYDGSSFSRMNNLTNNFYYGCTEVFNNKVYIIGGGSASTTNKYWFSTDDFSTYTKEGTLPISVYNTCCSYVYKDKINIHTNNGTLIYDGNDLTQEDTVTTVYYEKACKFNNKIHMFWAYNADTVQCDAHIAMDMTIDGVCYSYNMNVNFYYMKDGEEYNTSGTEISLSYNEDGTCPAIYIYDVNNKYLLFTNQSVIYNTSTQLYEIYGYFPTTLLGSNINISETKWQTLQSESPCIISRSV